ncbi:hypothetical protein Dimus_012847 [Dionaea muscipula]
MDFDISMLQLARLEGPITGFISSLLYFVNAYRFIYAGCSQEQYEPNSSFKQNLDSFFTLAIN